MKVLKSLLFLVLGIVDYFLAALLVKVAWNLTMPHAFPQLPHFSWIQAFVVSFILTILKGTKDIPDKYKNDLLGYTFVTMAEKVGFIAFSIPIAFVLHHFLT